MSRLRVVLATALLALLLSASSCVRATAPHAVDAMQGARGAMQNKAPVDDTDAAIAAQAPEVANEAAACDEILNVLAPDETPPEPGPHRRPNRPPMRR